MHDLPPYTYIPGRSPHPISHPEGHMYGAEHPELSEGEHFAFGIKLFDNGYYWEAHESWEHLWILLGRRGESADRVKGLIKLAACGVKVLEGNSTGAIRHATRALELLAGEHPTIQGFDFSPAARIAELYLERPFAVSDADPRVPKRLDGFRLQ